ncbi:MAG TPA: ABC transporter ATP-binding protein [Candidatus Aminicenantes bacterium]|nr:ABC transporter ATP-binding protein [Candidatus Aminicenantes bacterium]HRY64320.1 ABC transporter ATP-binding protein [Candidatus Aminicenantes bacterium]HRZ71233.1 ABC transporter ATP-binding protein [Candidatus Aminicenantes bacterium]
MSFLEIDRLSAGYDGRTVIHDVSLAVEPGEFVAILGRNGSGKSTLIKAVQNLIGRSAGRVRCGGEDVSGLGPRRLAARIAYVSQLAEPVFEYTVGEIVLMGRFARQGRLERFSAEDEAAAAEAMRWTDVEALRGQRLSQLSGGESQRVFIARALAQDAPLLLLDEPSSHLDIAYQVEIYRLLARLQKERAKAVMVAEHNINLAAAYAGRLVFLAGGTIAAEGPPEETVTAGNIRRIFGADVDIRANSRSGRPEVSLAGVGEKP